MSCLFCEIVAGSIAAEIVWRDAGSVGFLDHRPLFAGHVLLVPVHHIVTLDELPTAEVGTYFQTVQRLERAVEQAFEAEGTFIAINNRVSQSVPHLHTHIVPRRKGDGLKGFFWPRIKYRDDGHVRETGEKIRRALD